MPFPAAEPARQRLSQRAGVEQAMEVGAEHIALHTALPAPVGVVGEGFALRLGHAGVYLVAFQLCTRKGGGDGRFDLCAALLLAEQGPGGQQTQPPQSLLPAALAAGGVVEGLAQHLVAAAHPQHRRAAPGQLADGCFQPALAQPQQVVHGIFCTGQDHAVRRAKLAGGLHIAHAKQRVLLQRHKVRKVGNMRQPHNGSIQRLDGIFDLQPVGKRILVLNIRL